MTPEWPLISPGVLAVTRSLGDASVKEFVVGSPYTTETALDENDEFLIVACDGVSLPLAWIGCLLDPIRILFGSTELISTPSIADKYSFGMSAKTNPLSTSSAIFPKVHKKPPSACWTMP